MLPFGDRFEYATYTCNIRALFSSTSEHTPDVLRHILTTPLPLQVTIEASQIGFFTPGFRGLALTRKPASELRPSAQKFVQGTLELSLSTPPTAATAFAGAGSSANPVRGAKDATGIDGRDVEEGPHGTSRTTIQQQVEQLHESTKEKLPRASVSNVESDEGEWEGLTWSEDVSGDTGEPGTLGTVEVASKAEDGIGKGAFGVHEPEDLLISLRGAIDLRKVSVLIALQRIMRYL